MAATQRRALVTGRLPANQSQMVVEEGRSTVGGVLNLLRAEARDLFGLTAPQSRRELACTAGRHGCWGPFGIAGQGAPPWQRAEPPLDRSCHAACATDDVHYQASALVDELPAVLSYRATEAVPPSTP